MEWLKTHAPPAMAQDLKNVEGGLDEWDEFVSLCFRSAIDDLESDLPPHDGVAGVPQFFDAKQPVYCGLRGLIAAPVVWNAFPKSLTLTNDRAWAMPRADELWQVPAEQLSRLVPDGRPVPKGTFYFRPQDEYCEWRVERDAATGKIARVVFTCEPPEYWTALFGGTVRYGRTGKLFRFRGDPDYATQLYRDLTGQDVRRRQLAFPDGSYNRFNRWNSTHGIVHLSNFPNSISAEIQLAAESTILRRRHADHDDGAYAARHDHATLVTNADELICSGGFGEADRNSDPTIGATANALARLGAKLTLADPVGVYMDHIDVSGWSLPGGVKGADCFKIERGTRGMIERLVVEAPDGSGVLLGDMTIGGEIVRHGGQIAECITIKLLGAGDLKTTVRNGALERAGNAWLATQEPQALSGLAVAEPRPAGMRPAFGHRAVAGGVASPRLLPLPLPPHHATRRRT